MFSMLRNRKRNDEGVLLLDILIGIALLALIILLAVQTVSGLRARAYKAGAENDAKQMAMSIEAKLTDGGAVAALANADSATAKAAYPEANLTTGNDVTVVAVGTSDYTVCAKHTTGAYAVYESASGAVTASATTGGGAVAECS